MPASALKSAKTSMFLFSDLCINIPLKKRFKDGLTWMWEAGWYVLLAQTPAHNLKRFFIAGCLSVHMVTLLDTSYTHTHTHTLTIQPRNNHGLNLKLTLNLKLKVHVSYKVGFLCILCTQTGLQINTDTAFLPLTHTQSLRPPIVAAWETL